MSDEEQQTADAGGEPGRPCGDELVCGDELIVGDVATDSGQEG